MEATVNVQGFEQLKRVLLSVPEGQLDMTNWNSCACGHATRDEWFQSEGLTSCNDFRRAAAFFGLTRGQAQALFSGRKGRRVTATEVIQNIDQLLARDAHDSKPSGEARRQAIIDGLLVKANGAAHKARRVATALVGALF
jgi:hypothetical protein